jgi:PEGA domain-containing protein
LEVCVRSAIVLILVGVVAGPAYVSGTVNNARALATAQDAPTQAAVEIVAPIVLDVSEDGKSIGSTKAPKLSLPPGRHVLTLSNTEFGYTYTHTVELEAGDIRTITLDPRTSTELRATPQAEVWLNGEKIGDTPLVHDLPLGKYELVFKHPRFGERRVPVTIRASSSSPIRVDMRKSK